MAYGLGLTSCFRNSRVIVAPCCMGCHANLPLELRILGLRFGVPCLEHTWFISVIPHDEDLTTTEVLERDSTTVGDPNMGSPTIVSILAETRKNALYLAHQLSGDNP